MWFLQREANEHQTFKPSLARKQAFHLIGIQLITLAHPYALVITKRFAATLFAKALRLRVLKPPYQVPSVSRLFKHVFPLQDLKATHFESAKKEVLQQPKENIQAIQGPLHTGWGCSASVLLNTFLKEQDYVHSENLL